MAASSRAWRSIGGHARVLDLHVVGSSGRCDQDAFDANGQGDAAQAAVRTHMRTSEQRIERQLATLRRDHATSHPGDAVERRTRFSLPVLTA
jgi:hypothetical protein